ncbi:hypothetical protein VTO73DRAFT_9482 [Trametes versicolor]
MRKNGPDSPNAPYNASALSLPPRRHICRLLPPAASPSPTHPKRFRARAVLGNELSSRIVLSLRLRTFRPNSNQPKCALCASSPDTPNRPPSPPPRPVSLRILVSLSPSLPLCLPMLLLSEF